MSGTHLLFAFSDYNFMLRNEPDKRGRMVRVAYLREHATMMLFEAAKRMPVESDSIMAAYRETGRERVWQLENNQDAKQLCWNLRNYAPTSSEIHAAELLLACICAQELGDVPEFKLMHAGSAASKTQSDRRKGETKLSESQKKQVMREYEAAPVTYGMIKNLSRKFNVSESTISRLVKFKKINRD